MNPTNDGSKHKPKYSCLISDKDHFTKDFPRQSKVIHFLKRTSGIPIVLKEPFPSQKIQMVDKPQSSSSFGSQFFMSRTTPIHVSTGSKYYALLVGKEPKVPSSVPSSSFGPLHNERPSNELVIQPPAKCILQKTSYNTNACVAQHYSIVQDVAQAPLAIFALEIPQSCPP